MKAAAEAKDNSEKDLSKKSREMLAAEKKSKEDKKKIEQLEKRLELLLDVNFAQYAASADRKGGEANNSSNNSQSISKLRCLLADLVKENEELKKTTMTMSIELLRFSESEAKYAKQLTALNSKIDLMKSKISQKDLQQITSNQEEKLLFTNPSSINGNGNGNGYSNTTL